MSANFDIIHTGTDDFYKLITESTYIIDKSELIASIINGKKEAFLFPRPRRWGKSLNMSMLYYFFNIAVDKDGIPLPENPYKKLFENLKIAKMENANRDNILETYQGKNPVILVSFKGVGGSNFDEVLATMNDAIQDLYVNHQYLLKEIKPHEMEEFQIFLSAKASKSNLKKAISFLSRLLKEKFDREVYVLIDEYDKPINDAFGKAGYDSELFKETSDLVSGILANGIKGNDYLKKGVLTGILRTAKGNTFSGLNNVTEFNIASPQYIEHFGFLEEEVIELLNKIEGINKESELKIIREWYNGYSLPPGSSSPKTMYNPWSIANYINSIVMVGEEAQPENYWKDSGNNLIVKDLLSRSDVEIRSKLRKLIEGEEVAINIQKVVSYDEINGSNKMIWSLLFHTGYLSIRDYHEGSGIAKIPNKEVKEAYTDQIKYWFGNNEEIESSYKNFLNSLIIGDVEYFKEALANFAEKSFSYFDIGGQNPERVYHAFILGMLVDLRDKYQLISNQEAGFGRFDLCLKPIIKKEGKEYPDYSRLAVVIEFKRVALSGDIEKSAKDALLQIKENKYDSIIKDYEQKLLLGIAFQGKKTYVLDEML